jgi:deazaflavin-dependent oxidoreductase (nitroreductase family)
VNDFNDKIIEEFRANAGQVGGPFAGAPMVLLHTVGARSGAERVTPLVSQPLDDGTLAVFGSAAGADHHPAWFHNLVATPDVTVEVGADTRAVRARVAEGEERSRIWEAQKAAMPGFADYEAATDRVIPVVVLDPVT